MRRLTAGWGGGEFGNMKITGSELWSHERGLSERIALVRVFLTLATIIVIALGRLDREPGVSAGFSHAYMAALAFVIWAFSAWLALERKSPGAERWLHLAPIIDVFCAYALIITTGGYLSPFNMWLIFAIVTSGFSRYRRLPLITGVLALAAHCIISLVPQNQPLALSVFVVRTAYLFGLASVLSAVGFYLNREARALTVLESISRPLAEAMTRDQVVRTLLERLTTELVLDDAEFHGPSEETRRVPDSPVSGSPVIHLALGAGGVEYGEVTLARRMPLSKEESSIVRLLCDRASAALQRIRLSEELIEAAAVQERTRLADHLHDTSVQTLVALDLRAEAARSMAKDVPGMLAEEIAQLQKLAREAAVQCRKALVARDDRAPSGPTVLRRILNERWPGRFDLDIEPDVPLSDAQWDAVAMLLKEGVNNAKKHGRANHIAVTIASDAPNEVVCCIRSDGPPIQTPIRFGYGLSRLQELMAEHGGALRLAAPKSGGAILWAEFGPDTNSQQRDAG